MVDHVYLSTACLHERHDHCNAMVGYEGVKRPAQCKWCEARCICVCHSKEFSLGGCVRFTPRRVTNIQIIVDELLWECSLCHETGSADLSHPMQMTQRQMAAQIQHRHGRGKGGCS